MQFYVLAPVLIGLLANLQRNASLLAFAGMILIGFAFASIAPYGFLGRHIHFFRARDRDLLSPQSPFENGTNG